MEGIRFANMVLPEPGGPIMMTLCPPAAAISKARLMLSCPLTSAKSYSYWLRWLANSARVSTMVCSNSFSPLKWSITCLTLSAPYTSRLLTMAASRAFSLGIIIPLSFCLLASIAMGNTPLIGRRLPSSDNSPITTYLSNSSARTSPLAARIPIAIVRSYAAPSFLISAGAIFTTTRLPGMRKPY